jgi:hypothetical protein
MHRRYGTPLRAINEYCEKLLTKPEVHWFANSHGLIAHPSRQTRTMRKKVGLRRDMGCKTETMV